MNAQVGAIPPWLPSYSQLASNLKTVLSFLKSVSEKCSLNEVDTPRSEDAGILKDKLWGMNPPKLRFLKGKSDTRYPLAHC